jgi:transmembrane sensor
VIGNAISSRELAAMTANEAAAYWFVRHDSGSITAEEELRFQEWLADSDINRCAYEQTEAMWSGFVDAADAGELRALRVAALAATLPPRVWPRAATLAAAILVAVGISGFLGYRVAVPRLTRVEISPASPTATHYATAHNQRSTISLSDGTLVSMNLDTVIDSDFASGKRLVRLLRGQAFFAVAKDKAHPFIVFAGDRQIRALGTQFDVRLDPNRIEVVLVEGRVNVERGAETALDRLTRRQTHVEMTPGQRLVAMLGEAATVTETDAAQATSWREGWVTFQDESLESAIAELNRYSARPIVAEGAAVKQLRLSGVFRIGEPERFGALIEEVLPVTAEPGPAGEIRLLPKVSPGSSGRR